MRVTFEHSLLKRFSLVLALIAVVTGANHLALNRAIEDGRWLVHTHAVLEQVERVASLLKDAETSQRGYLLVGRDDYLKPYHAAIGSIGPEMDRLGMLTRDDPRQQERIVALRALSARRLDRLRGTIEVRRSGGLHTALTLVQTDRGMRLMDDIRDVVRAMKTEECALLEGRSARSVAANRTVIFLTWLGAAVCLLVLYLAYGMVRGELIRRRAVEGRLRDSEAAAHALNAELERTNALLAEQATTDGLTGLKNKRFLDEALEVHFSRAVRQREPLSVVLLDVDRFKPFNDAYGHQAGDDVLRAVAASLKGSVRDHDVVARYGGEEFLVVLPNTDRDACLAVAERLRAGIERHAWRLRPVTASFGAATLSSEMIDPSVLVEHADRALYRSKGRGRNRVTHRDDAHFEDADPAVASPEESGRLSLAPPLRLRLF
jgi:diguanylate cyclase (GGDEF)-like protein